MLSGFLGGRAADKSVALFYGAILLLIFAPLFWGGNHPLPLLLMELLALVLLVGWFLRPSVGGQSLSQVAWVFLALLFFLPLLQLVPVPFIIWEGLPGRAFYADLLRYIGPESEDFRWRALSLVPSMTESAWLALLPPLAVFVVAVHLPSQQLFTLTLVFLGTATGEALLGLIQYGDGANSAFRFGNHLMGLSASGTYINRNHLAGLLEMALPIALALLTATIGHGVSQNSSRRSRRKRNFRQWLAHFSVARVNQTAVFAALGIAILLGLIFTRSRSGISVAMLGILLCTLLFSYRLGGRNTYGLMGTFSAVGLGLAGLIGLAPIWIRFAYIDPIASGRWKIFDATLQAIGEFFPLGSGAGTFEEVIRRFHPVDLPGITINHAHNEYLEWLLELGLPAALLLAVGLIFYCYQWAWVLKRGYWQPFRFAQAGAGISLFLMMMHSMVDFNLRIPANAVFAAFLAALFFHRPLEKASHSSSHRRGRKDSQGGEQRQSSLSCTIPPENRINPFAS